MCTREHRKPRDIGALPRGNLRLDNFFAEVIFRVKKMTSAQDIQMPVTHNSFSLTPLVRTTRFRQGNHSWVRRLSIQQQR